MKKIISSFLFVIAVIAAGTVATSCKNAKNNANDPSNVQRQTRTVGDKTPKLSVYIETNDINPLNAGEYFFCDTTEGVIDHIILFASNIRGNATSVWLHHNNNQTHILNNVDTLVVPLQQKGIKVMLGLLGDWTGVGFSNLTPEMVESFAQDLAGCVNTYGLDGVNFSDSYADYANAPAGLPIPSATIYGNLIQRVKELLPNKLVTAYHWSYALYFDAATLNVIDYMFPNYGCSSTPPTGFPNSKWAKLSMQIGSQAGTNPSQSITQVCAINYTGYGAIMMFNLREWDTSSIMNWFAPQVWGGRTVCWTGVSHPKNY